MQSPPGPSSARNRQDLQFAVIRLVRCRNHGAVQDPQTGLHDERAASLQAGLEKGKQHATASKQLMRTAFCPPASATEQQLTREIASSMHVVCYESDKRPTKDRQENYLHSQWCCANSPAPSYCLSFNMYTSSSCKGRQRIRSRITVVCRLSEKSEQNFLPLVA